jgi:lipoprotein-anchoring transpeptidase ErfK/SrfK
MQQVVRTVNTDRPGRRTVAALFLALGVLGSAAATWPEAASTNAAVTRPNDGVHISVDLSERRLVIEDGGQAVRTFGVAIGKPTHPTPTGRFTLRKMIWNPGWVPPKGRAWSRGKTPKDPGDPKNPMQSVKIFFREPYYYIHGTNSPQSIGAAASHGCLRMTPEDAAELGAYLMERGGQPREENWFRRVLRLGRSTVIYLDNPIGMTIRA